MAEMWDTAGKIKVFHKKAVFFCSWPGAFQKNISLTVNFVSACRESMMREIFIQKQLLNDLPPPRGTFCSIIRSMHQ